MAAARGRPFEGNGYNRYLQRSALMREMEGLSTKEVGEITGMSEANVKTRLRRARLMLRQRLEGA